MLLAPLAPGFRLKLAGVTPRVKLGWGVTVSAIASLPDMLPEVPVTVTVDVPAKAVPAAVNVTLLLPAITSPKAAVTPAGSPLAASATVLLKPFRPEIETVLVLLPPGLTLKLAGVTPSVKLGCGVMVKAILTVLVTLPDLPVIVTVASPADAFDDAVSVNVLAPAVDAVSNVAVTP